MLEKFEKAQEAANKKLEAVLEIEMKKAILKICKGRLKNRTIEFDDYFSTSFEISTRKGGVLKFSSDIYQCGADFKNEKGHYVREVSSKMFPLLEKFGELMNAYNQMTTNSVGCSFTISI